MAIFVTGDTHGDFSRFKQSIFYEQENLSKDDSLIVCGDFGGLWNNSLEEIAALDWLDSLPFTTLFVCGNHENFDILSSYKAEKWNGGLVHKIRPSVIHLMRGQVFTLEGRHFFTMGGARSHDISDGILDPYDPFFKQKSKRLERDNALYRINHISWWKEEMPNEEEYATAVTTLEASHWSVDYIITHCCPLSIQTMFSKGVYKSDTLLEFFDSVADRCSFKHWYFGHYHDNQNLLNRYTMLYEQIIQIL